MELTLQWKSPQVSNLTVKSISSAVSTGSTVLLQTGLCACPFTYMMPWKFLSSISNCTLTPSAKQLTSISGRGNGWIGGGVVGIGTKSNQIKLINWDFAVYQKLKYMSSFYLSIETYHILLDQLDHPYIPQCIYKDIGD